MRNTSRKSSRRSVVSGRIVVGLWITAAVWLVALFFYLMVTERYFTNPLAGLLIDIPATMIVCAILLQSWRKNWPGNKAAFYTTLAVWGLAWGSMMAKSFWN